MFPRTVFAAENDPENSDDIDNQSIISEDISIETEILEIEGITW